MKKIRQIEVIQHSAYTAFRNLMITLMLAATVLWVVIVLDAVFHVKWSTQMNPQGHTCFISSCDNLKNSM